MIVNQYVLDGLPAAERIERITTGLIEALHFAEYDENAKDIIEISAEPGLVHVTMLDLEDVCDGNCCKCLYKAVM